MHGEGAVLRTEAITKVYRSGAVEVHALRGVDFALSAGELVVLVGPSGSGKLTLLNILGGLATLPALVLSPIPHEDPLAGVYMEVKVLPVYRYQRSGKLVAVEARNLAFPLNGDLTFSSGGPHGIRRSTEIEKTRYRVEVEITRQKGGPIYKIVRSWREDSSPKRKETDPRAPLESRIDITPAEALNEEEKQFVGVSEGHPVGYTLVVLGVIGFLLSSSIYALLIPIAGIVIAVHTRTEGDSAHLAEVHQAKERVRRRAQQELDRAMQDMEFWASLDGNEFEHAVEWLFRHQGYSVESTKRAHDEGVDLILKRGSETYLVQCKAYAKNVGIAPVRELQGTRSAWPDEYRVMLVSLYGFSNGARDFAQAHGIKLFSIAHDHIGTYYRPT